MCRGRRKNRLSGLLGVYTSNLAEGISMVNLVHRLTHTPNFPVGHWVDPYAKSSHWPIGYSVHQMVDRFANRSTCWPTRNLAYGSEHIQGSWVPYTLPAMCLDISSAEAQLGQVHATVRKFDITSDGVAQLSTRATRPPFAPSKTCSSIQTKTYACRFRHIFL